MRVFLCARACGYECVREREYGRRAPDSAPSLCVCVRGRVCVRARERKNKLKSGPCFCVCVCVCVCVSERACFVCARACVHECVRE